MNEEGYGGAYTGQQIDEAIGKVISGGLVGPQGPQGEQGPKGDTGASGVYMGTEEPTDPNVNVWINPDGTSSGGTGDGLEVYSTEETRIGTWIDGKPLYRKTCQYTFSVKKGTFFLESLPSNVPDTAFITKFDATASVGKYFYSIPLATHDLFITCQLNPSNKVDFMSIWNGDSTFNAIITYEYTKTTDPEVTT